MRDYTEVRMYLKQSIPSLDYSWGVSKDDNNFNLLLI